MLQQMHDGIRGWVAWLIIGVIIAALSLLGINSRLRSSHGSNNIAAKVGGTSITQAQVDVLVKQTRQYSLKQFSNEPALRQNLVQLLVAQTLLTETAKRNGFKISKDLLDSVITQIPEFQENNEFSSSRFASLLDRSGYTPTSFIENVSLNLLTNQLRKGIFETEFILPNEIKTTQRILKQTRDFSYATLKFSKYLPKAAVSDEVAKTYYQTNLSRFKTPEEIRLDYLVLTDKTVVNPIQPTVAQLKKFYQDTINDYAQPEQYQLAHIVLTDSHENSAELKVTLKKIAQALQAKEDFNAVAKRFSDKSKLAKKTTSLAWAALNSLPTAVKTAVAPLKVGEVSAPIATANGYEIIKVVALKPAQVMPFTQITDKVSTAYSQQQARQQFAELAQKLTDYTFQNSDSLAPAAAVLNLPVQTSDWLTNSKTQLGLFANPQLLGAAFSPSVRNGNNSEILYPDAHTAVVMRVNQYHAPKTQPFMQVKERIKALLAVADSRKQAKLVAAQVTKQLNGGAGDESGMGGGKGGTGSLSEVAYQYGLHWQTLQNVSRDDAQKNVAALILQTAFILPRPLAANAISATSVELPDQAIAIIGLTGIHEQTPAATLAPQESAYQAQWQRYSGELALLELVDYYRQKIRPKIY